MKLHRILKGIAVTSHLGEYTASADGKSAMSKKSAWDAVAILAQAHGFPTECQLIRIAHLPNGCSHWEIRCVVGNVKQVTPSEEHSMTTLNLALRIADNTCRSEIELNARQIRESFDKVAFNLAQPASEISSPAEADREVSIAACAAKYIEQRGDVFAWRMLRDAEHPHIVRFIDKEKTDDKFTCHNQFNATAFRNYGGAGL